MHHYTLALVGLVSLFGAGCSRVSPSSMLQPLSSAQSERVQSAANEAVFSHRVAFPESWTRPTEVHPQQLHYAYQISQEAGFAFVEQRNSNQPLIPKDGTPFMDPISFAGLLFTADQGKTWGISFSIPTSTLKDEWGPVHLNPIGMFWADKRYALDLLDDRGAGSGEGNVIRFWTKDGRTWERDPHCYYYVSADSYPHNQLPFEAPEADFDPPAPITELKTIACPAYADQLNGSSS